MITRERLLEIVAMKPRWDHLFVGEDMKCAPAEIQEMARELLATRWRQITETEWPTFDEQKRSLEVVVFNEDGSLKYLSGVGGRAKCNSFYWTSLGYTHFRAINPPERKEQP